ncbi:MAG: alpha/beta fold hydrolase [Leptospirales bacterium]|jgi:medium-chain acyl-[acyl-carrier-protein] hydrolase
MPEAWFIREVERPLAALDLFCFPPAGGTSGLYRNWHRALPESIQVHAIELPGREARFSETPFQNMGGLLDELVPKIESARHPNRPFVLFGHSMGASIAFETTRRLRERNGAPPALLCLSGRKPPQTPERFALMHDLSESDFIDGLRAYGGTPEAVLQNEELMELFVPLLRADFSLFETWPYEPQPPLRVPFAVFGGEDDPRALRGELQAWRIHTAADFRLRMLPGGHFFLRDEEALMLDALGETILSQVKSPTFAG